MKYFTVHFSFKFETSNTFVISRCSFDKNISALKWITLITPSFSSAGIHFLVNSNILLSYEYRILLPIITVILRQIILKDRSSVLYTSAPLLTRDQI